MQPTAQAVGKQREEGTSPSGAKENARLDKPEPPDSRWRLSHMSTAG